jgi:cyclophilin family peptidyl-prolyl cis-trans isomerase
MANKTALIKTDKGDITVELNEDKAPVTAGNFIELAKKGFYDGLNFHRVEPGFVIQGGCPQGTGMGGSGKNIPLEIHPDLRHDSAGVLAMARSQDPNSASSQFYITLGAASFLDDNYAVFGKVTDGLDAVKSIRVGDKIQSITVQG